MGFMEWLGLSPAYSLFAGATLWLVPILAEAAASLVYSPGWVAQQATSFFRSFHLYLDIFPFSIAAGFLFSIPQIWAWNRRADRLNREASLPPPTLAAVPGVWPPPPSVPASIDHTKG